MENEMDKIVEKVLRKLAVANYIYNEVYEGMGEKIKTLAHSSRYKFDEERIFNMIFDEIEKNDEVIK
jgi:hypothetical protein